MSISSSTLRKTEIKATEWHYLRGGKKLHVFFTSDKKNPTEQSASCSSSLYSINKFTSSRVDYTRKL